MSSAKLQGAMPRGPRAAPRLARALRSPTAGVSEPESLLVTRAMTDAERAVVAISTLPPALTWGVGGAAVGGVVALAACAHGAHGSAVDVLSSCPIGTGVVAGEVLGVFAGAARGAAEGARRLGCKGGESRRRAFGGALLGTLWGLAPAALYVAVGGRSVLVAELAIGVVAPVTQVVGAARGASRCRLPVPILH
jgi:hypothetical protein